MKEFLAKATRLRAAKPFRFGVAGIWISCFLVAALLILFGPLFRWGTGEAKDGELPDLFMDLAKGFFSPIITACLGYLALTKKEKGKKDRTVDKVPAMQGWLTVAFAGVAAFALLFFLGKTLLHDDYERPTPATGHLQIDPFPPGWRPVARMKLTTMVCSILAALSLGAACLSKEPE